MNAWRRSVTGSSASVCHLFFFRRGSLSIWFWVGGWGESQEKTFIENPAPHPLSQDLGGLESHQGLCQGYLGRVIENDRAVCWSGQEEGGRNSRQQGPGLCRGWGRQFPGEAKEVLPRYIPAYSRFLGHRQWGECKEPRCWATSRVAPFDLRTMFPNG